MYLQQDTTFHLIIDAIQSLNFLYSAVKSSQQVPSLDTVQQLSTSCHRAMTSLFPFNRSTHNFRIVLPIPPSLSGIEDSASRCVTRWYSTRDQGPRGKRLCVISRYPASFAPSRSVSEVNPCVDTSEIAVVSILCCCGV